MKMNDSRKTILIVAVAAVTLLSVFGCSGPPSKAERTTTKAGPITPMSSMLGPDASGKPKTERPADAPGAAK